MVRRFSMYVLKSLLLYAACASPAFAQGGRAELGGTVLDQAKAVLPGVTVTVTNDATGQARQAVTGGEGRFVIPTLMPGTYTIKGSCRASSRRPAPAWC